MRQRLLNPARLWACGLAILVLVTFSSPVPAGQSEVPKNLIRQADGNYQPAPGYDWLTNDAKDLRVRWVPGKRHPVYSNTLAATKAGDWQPAAGFRWATNDPKDLRVVKAGPTDNDIAKAVLKAVGALVLHQKSLPRPDDDLLDSLGRELARQARDTLIGSALQDLLPDSQAGERSTIQSLVILALEGRLDRNPNRVIGYLRRTNPTMANVVEAADFVIQLAKALDGRR